jgi:hypothetical protein
MLERFRRIKREFGTKAFVRLILLLAGLVLMAIAGWGAFNSPWATVVAIAGLGFGWVFRQLIVERIEWLAWALPIALTVSGIVFFVGEKVLDLDREAQLLLITGTIAAAFSIEYWALSDPTVFKIEN